MPAKPTGNPLSDLTLSLVHQLLLAGVIGAIGLASTHLGEISKDLNAIKTQLAVAIDKVGEHDKRLDRLEERVYHPQ